MSAARLAERAAAWTARRRLAALVLAAGAAAGAWALARGSAGLAAAAVSGLVAYLYVWRRLGSVSPADVARELDAAHAELESSTALLLQPDDALTPLARLQRERVAARLGALVLAPPPWRQVGRAGAVGVALAAFGAAGGAWLHRERPTDVAVAPAAAPGRRPLALRLLAREVIPPSYTGLRARRDSGWAGEVEEGSVVRWRVATDDEASAVRLVADGADTAAFARDGGEWVHATTVRAPAVIRLEAIRGGDTVRTPWSPLAVRADAPPVATLERPGERTLVMPWDPDSVAVAVGARDDYGVVAGELVLTIASGKGEGVTFRERRVPLAGRGGRDTWRAALVLRPRALGLAPGDEMYVHAEVRDARAPVPNVGRSGTAVVVLADTAETPLADFAGILPSGLPDYFRSQRQIIIDTEKLLRAERAIPRDSFNSTSNEIGFDQGALRMRYGELVGDEQTFVAEPHDDHEAEGEQSAAAEPVPEELLHRHDDAENATRLAQGTKSNLQLALAEMWEAEKYLRTFQPRLALPYEYRALEYLKLVQQSARAYVLRVGSRPNPIDEPAVRLTGEVRTPLAPRARRELPSAAAFPAVRAALAALGPASGAPLDAAQRAALEAAARELAADALVDRAASLAALGAVRTLLDAADAERPAALAAASAALWRRLPPAVPAAAGTAGAPGPLERRFIRRLEAGR